MEGFDIDNFSDIFFSPVKVELPVDKEYKKCIPRYVRAANAQSQISNASVYIFDYVEKKFVYMAEKEKMMFGYSTSEIENIGVLFFKNILYSEDIELFKKINSDGFNYFFNKLEPSDRHNYWATYDLRTVTKDNEVELYNFRFFPFVVDENGNLILAMVQIDISTRKKPGNFSIYSIKEKKFLEYNSKKKCYMPVKQRLLSKKEKTILKLFSKGFTIKEVGDILSIESNSLSYYNKSILLKLEAGNMKEAVFLFAQRGDIY